LSDKEWDYQCQLEEVIENSEDSIEQYCCKKRLEGWKMSRILISLCLANTDNMKKAFVKGYLSMNKDKTEYDANKYYFVFMKQFGSKIKRKKET
jgi:hypothetical protein